MKPDHIKKLYYSIQEVREMTGVKKHVLRFWESEFSKLRPSKNRAGNRTYRENDIKTVFLIKQLLHEERLTIEDARLKMKEIKKKGAEQQERSLKDLKREDALLEIRRDIREILAMIDEALPEEKGEIQSQKNKSAAT